MLPSVGNFHHFKIVFTKFSSSGRHHGTTISKNFEKKIIHLFVFLIHSFVIYYSLICIFLFTCFYSCKALLNLILAPTCKTDYLVLICCFHRKLQFKEFSRNTIDLHVYYPRECNHLENLSKLKHNKNDKMPQAL